MDHRTAPDETDDDSDGDVDSGSGFDSSSSSNSNGRTEMEPESGTSGRREVVVPLRLYKTITVFSTLIAVVGILGGFIVLDVATNRAQADFSEVNIAAAILGVGMIVAGAVTYAFSTRFRTTEMGNAKDDTDEHSDNG